jgi:nucleoside 2-deoxyribosyltransferase
MPRIYLAGPITGLTYEESVTWRKQVSDVLTPLGIQCFCPMRTKDALSGPTHLQTLLRAPRSIQVRDHNDCIHADCLLVNFLGAKRVSIGTVMEIAWAYTRQIPVVCLMEPGNLHDHEMIQESISFRVSNIQDGIEIVKSILLPV